MSSGCFKCTLLVLLLFKFAHFFHFMISYCLMFFFFFFWGGGEGGGGGIALPLGRSFLQFY